MKKLLEEIFGGWGKHVAASAAVGIASMLYLITDLTPQLEQAVDNESESAQSARQTVAKYKNQNSNRRTPASSSSKWVNDGFSLSKASYKEGKDINSNSGTNYQTGSTASYPTYFQRESGSSARSGSSRGKSQNPNYFGSVGGYVSDYTSSTSGSNAGFSNVDAGSGSSDSRSSDSSSDSGTSRSSSFGGNGGTVSSPTITSVAATSGDGAYGEGEEIIIKVTFSESVNVNGSPRIDLDSGGVAVYSSGSDSNTVYFSYTVDDGDNSDDLDVESSSSFALSGGTIIGVSGGGADLTLPAYGSSGSLAENSDIRVDTTEPSLVSVSVPSDRGYKAGDYLEITLEFNEEVTTNSSSLALSYGVSATYSSGSGTTKLVYRYIVLSGDDVSYIDVNNISGLDIEDAANNAFSGTIPAGANLADNNNIFIDTVAPTITSINGGATVDGYYNSGKILDISVVFSEEMTTSSSYLNLNSGGKAVYLSGSDSNTIIYRYTVAAGENATDLDVDSITVGDLVDLASNDLDLNIPPGQNLADNQSFVIDTTTPSITNIDSFSSNGNYAEGTVIDIQVNFNDKVNAVGSRLYLNSGASADYLSGSGSSTIIYRYNVVAGDMAADLTVDSVDFSKVADFATNPASNELPAGRNLGENKNIIIDTSTPKLTAIVAPAGNGAYTIGDVVSIQVIFSKPIIGTGSSLDLNVPTSATYVSGSGSTVFTYNYTVQAGDNTLDLTVTNLNAAGATDLAGTDLVTDLPLGANLGDTQDIIIDTVFPTLEEVTTQKADGLYTTGEVIDIEVVFNEPIFVTGTPQLTLNTTPIQVVDYVSGHGTNRLVFTYTVSANDASSDLDYAATNSLSLNGGVLLDVSGNAPTLTLATPNAANSISDDKEIEIDAIDPYVTSVSSPIADGSYKAGDVINIDIVFSEPVVVTGTPQLTLNNGAVVDYTAGSTTNTLRFAYTISGGEDIALLAYDSVNALALNSGTIKDPATNDAVLTLPTPGALSSLSDDQSIAVDTIAATVVEVATSKADGYYTTGEVIDFTVTFSEPVYVSGTPRIELDSSGYANYLSGDGTDTWTFRYTVALGEGSADLDYASTSSLQLNGGTINDIADNATNLTLATPGALNSISDDKAIVIDSTQPTVANITSPDSDGYYIIGDTILIDVQFSETVLVTGTPTLTLNSGGVASYISGDNTDTLRFSYTVNTNDYNADLDAANTTALSFAGGNITDLSTNVADLTLPTPNALNSLSDDQAIFVDGVIPTVMEVNSATADGYYMAGETINIQVVFSEPVNVVGVPTLALDSGATVNYTSGTGTNTLLFSYTVAAGDTSADLDYTSVNALTAGTSIKDYAGNDATLTLATPNAANSISDDMALVVDTDPSAVVEVRSPTADGYYKAGEVIVIEIEFDEPVNVTGTPQITLNSGATVDYSSGSSTNVLTFNYTIGAGQTSADLDYTNTSSLALNGGAIKDYAGNDSALSLASPGAVNSIADDKAIVIDTTVATVLEVATSKADGYYTTGEVIDITVTFSEAVYVTGSPRIALNSSAYANYLSGDGTTTWTFRYIVALGQASADLDYSTTTSLELNGGAISDIADNATVLTLASPGAVNSISDDKAIVIDSAVPTILNVTSPEPDGYYIIGDTILIDVQFSETVLVTGTPQLILNSGGVADYISGHNTDTMRFSYTVGVGDYHAALDANNNLSLIFNGGNITDLSTNQADRTTLPNPTALNSLSDDQTLFVDGVIPTVTDVASSTADGYYMAGDTINVEVTFSEPINVVGTPTIALDSGATVNYTSGTGTNTLLFSYTVGAGDTSSDLDYTTINALTAGTSIKDFAGNNATLTLATPGAVNSISDDKAIVVDTDPSAVSEVRSPTADGSYKAGDLVVIEVVFDEPVNVTGTPNLNLNSSAVVDYTSGSGSTTLIFSYTVGAGETAADLDYINTSSLSLNGGTINDLAGNASSLNLATPNTINSISDDKAIEIDTSAATVLEVATTKANGYYNELEIIDIDVTFSEPVYVTGTPEMFLNSGGVASYVSGSGTANWVFRYIVGASENSSDLDYSTVNSLTLNGGTIVDIAGNSTVLTLATPGTLNSISDDKAIVIDTVTPTISEVRSSKPDGNYIAGDVISIEVVFTESVVVTGSPVLSLNSSANVNYSSGSTSNILVFNYTVAVGDESADLDYASTSSLSLAGATITDPSGNAADTTLVIPGAINSISDDKAIAIDANYPTIAEVRSTTADGYYKAGELIQIEAVFSETVFVIGTPTLTLDSGAVVNYTSGSGTNTLLFNYTIAGGQNSSDLDYSATNSLTAGASIQDSFGNDAVLTLANPNAINSISDDKAIVVDTVAPFVTGISSTNPNGNYNAGDVITIEVALSEPVSVTGTPQLTLNSGAVVNYSSGSGSNTLIFSYTIGAGENTSSLDYNSVNALALNSGSIRDLADNPADLALASPGTSGSISDDQDITVDTNVPTITNVTTFKANGTYTTPELINVVVTFSEAVNVSGGTPSIVLNSGGIASYTIGTGSNTLTFAYTVGAGESSSDLDYVSSNSLSLNSATIADDAGNNATLTMPTPGNSGSISDDKNIIIDAIVPTVTDVNSSKADGIYTSGEVININVVFSEVVNVAGTPQLALNSAGTANYSSGSGTNTLVFSYTVGASQSSSDLDYSNVNALTAGTIEDAVGNSANRTLATPGTIGSVSDNKAIQVDTLSPTVTSVASSTANGNYNAGDTITIQVNFSESVNVSGTPTLSLNSGGTASYSSGSGSSTLVFSYTVGAGQNTTDLDYSAANSLTAGTYIRDAAGNNAVRTLASPGALNSISDDKAITIDTNVPTVTEVNSSIADGYYSVGTNISINVVFSEAVVVSGTPTLTLNSGGTASYSSGSGSSTLVFNYTVGAGQNSSDLDYSATNSLSAGTYIRDAAGNNAIRTLASPGAANSISDNKTIVIDTVSAYVVDVTTTSPSGTYTAGDLITILVKFNESVAVTGVPQLQLNSSATVDFTVNAGTILVFEYTVGVGESTLDLEYLATSSLVLNGGSIKDLAGNTAGLTLPTPGALGSISDNLDVVIDAIVPTVTGVTSSVANGTYGIGDVIPIRVVFSEAVIVTGTPRIAINTGDIVNYVSGSGSTSLMFNYTVGAGDTSSDLGYNATGSLTLNGGTIRDAAGNNATLTLASPGAANSLRANKAIVIDGNAPYITSVNSTTANGYYNAGDTIQIQVYFNETVTVTPEPRMILNSGGAVGYTSGSGSNTLTFSYVVSNGENTADLGYANTTALSFNTGTIVDAAGNSAVLTLVSPGAAGSLRANKAIVIDTINPTVTITTYPTITWSNYTSYTFGGACSENGRAVSYNVGGVTGSVSCSSGSWSATINTSAAPQGSTTISVTHTDTAGNTGSASRTVTKDSIRPSAPTVASPTDGSEFTDPSQTITGNCETGTTVSITGDISPSPRTATCSGGTYSISVTFTSAIEAKDMYVTQVDAVGNSSTPTTVSYSLIEETTGGTVAAGNKVSCFLEDDKQIYCSGAKSQGITGHPQTPGDYTIAQPIDMSATGYPNSFQMVSAGDGACALHDNNAIYCWGKHNTFVGGSAAQPTPYPVDMSDVPEANEFKYVASGAIMSCGIHLSGQAFCWGNNTGAGLGTGNTGSSSYKASEVDMSLTGDANNFQMIAPSGFGTCAIHANGKMYCWGYNSDGSVGLGVASGTITTPEPVEMSHLGKANNWKYVAASQRGYPGSTICGIHNDGTLYCWGSGDQNRLGNGSTSDVALATAVDMSAYPGDDKFTMVSVGYRGACAISTSKKLYCWGNNNSGEIMGVISATPELIDSSNYIDVSIGGYGSRHMCVRRENKEVYCSGYNANGEVGGLSTSSTYPYWILQDHLN